MKKFLASFVLLLLSLFFVEQLPTVQRHAVEPFTFGLARLSAFLAQSFDGDVYSRGDALSSRANAFSVVIRPGCNGVEAMLILVSAMLAFPAAWRSKVVGLVVGMLAIQLLNLVRIISLFYLGQWSMPLFKFSHLHLWPAMIMLDALIVFLVWVHRQPRDLRGDQGADLPG